MKYFVKAWKVEKKWLDLGVQARSAFMEQIANLVQLMVKKGAEVVASSECDQYIRYGLDCTFFAIWRFPENELEQEFESLLEKSGWYDFFYQENIRGSDMPMEKILERLTYFDNSALVLS